MLIFKRRVFVPLDNFERSLCDGFRPFHTAVPPEIAIYNIFLKNIFSETPLFKKAMYTVCILKVTKVKHLLRQFFKFQSALR